MPRGRITKVHPAGSPMSTTIIVVIVLLLAAVTLAVLLWRALERRDEAPEPHPRGVLAVDLRDRDTSDEL